MEFYWVAYKPGSRSRDWRWVEFEQKISGATALKQFLQLPLDPKSGNKMTPFMDIKSNGLAGLAFIPVQPVELKNFDSLPG